MDDYQLPFHLGRADFLIKKLGTTELDTHYWVSLLHCDQTLKSNIEKNLGAKEKNIISIQYLYREMRAHRSKETRTSYTR